MSQNPFDSDYGMEDDVGLDEDSKPVNDRDLWLKMTKGQVLRVSFVYFHPIDLNFVNRSRVDAKKKGQTLTPDQIRTIGQKAIAERAGSLSKMPDSLTQVDRLDLTEVKFKKMMASYQQGLGFVVNRLGKDGPDADAVWRKISEPKVYYSTLLFVYPTDRAGNIDRERLPTEWVLVPWRFGNRVYEDIWKLHAGLKDNGMGLHTQDLRLECKDAQYQNINVSFVGPALWQRSDKFRNVVLAKAIGMYDKLVPFREMTTDQLRAKLGLGGSAVSDTSVTAEIGDFAAVLDGV
jgi:hypothetical protein